MPPLAHAKVLARAYRFTEYHKCALKIRDKLKFSDEDIKAVAAHIHQHRQAAEIVRSTLHVVGEYMLFDAGTPASDSNDSTHTALQDALSALNSLAARLETQLKTSTTAEGVAAAQAWALVRDELLGLGKRSDAAAIALIRSTAIAARSLAAETLSTSGLSRNKELTKAVRDAAATLHRASCMHDLERAKHLLDTTTEGLLVPINILEGKPLTQTLALPINVLDIVRESVAAHTSVAQQRGIEFRTRFQCATAYAAIDKNDLLHVLANLFSNAIKYMGTLEQSSSYECTWITVIVSATPKLIAIAIQSWGAPFTPDEVQSGSIFEWGRRGHFAWKIAGVEGSGVGLHDARSIIRRAGGQITLDTEPVPRFSSLTYKTALFTVHLPRLDD